MTKTIVFEFHSDHAPAPKNVRHLVRVTRETDNKSLLLRLISAALRFPEYFGFNWDALDECLADLSWLAPGEVVIWHEAVPLSSEPQELSRYLAVLKNAQQDLSSRSLTISFPESGRKAIEG